MLLLLAALDPALAVDPCPLGADGLAVEVQFFAEGPANQRSEPLKCLPPNQPVYATLKASNAVYAQVLRHDAGDWKRLLPAAGLPDALQKVSPGQVVQTPSFNPVDLAMGDPTGGVYLYLWRPLKRVLDVKDPRDAPPPPYQPVDGECLVVLPLCPPAAAGRKPAPAAPPSGAP